MRQPPQITSPNEIEIWEGFVTLAFFPAMLITAYAVDKKPWLWRRGQASDLVGRCCLYVHTKVLVDV
jgi:hypothetical protein